MPADVRFDEPDHALAGIGDLALAAGLLLLAIQLYRLLTVGVIIDGGFALFAVLYVLGIAAWAAGRPRPLRVPVPV